MATAAQHFIFQDSSTHTGADNHKQYVSIVTPGAQRRFGNACGIGIIFNADRQAKQRRQRFDDGEMVDVRNRAQATYHAKFRVYATGGADCHPLNIIALLVLTADFQQLRLHFLPAIWRFNRARVAQRLLVPDAVFNRTPTPIK